MSNHLTSNTAVPTFARGALRAFIKGQPGFNAWIAGKGVPSREVRNTHLIEFAIAHGLSEEVLTILKRNTAGKVARQQVEADKVRRYVDACGGCDSIDEFNAMQALKAKEDAAVVVGAGVADAFNADAVKESEIVEANAPSSIVGVSDVLASVDQFISPLVRAELEKALQPLVDAANKPAITVERVVEVEKVVEVEAAAKAPAGVVPFARPGDQIKLRDLFGFKGKLAAFDRPVTVWDSHGTAPFIDPFYVVNEENMAMLALAVERGTNVWLAGPGGSGKSTMPEQFCAFTGRPFFKLTFNRQTEVADLIGGKGFDVRTFWEDGALIQAVKRPGTVILLDELTLTPAGVQGIIQGIADDHRSITLPTGEIVKCAKGVVFVVADNTRGYGDESGQYAGTHQSNSALVNRFKRMIVIDYMSKADEAKALVNHTGCTQAAADHMADFVARVRKMPEMENVVLSLRNMVGFVQTVQDGFSAKQAMDVTILNRLPATERAAVAALATLTWTSEFEVLCSGVNAPAAPAPAAPSAAGRAFDDEVSATFNR